MESGRSALKLTTASYFRPSGINIHRFPDSKKEDDWGVKPDEGHVVELNKDQWLEWTKAREMVDAVYGQTDSAEPSSFKDLQLVNAVDYLVSLAVPGGSAETAVSGVTPAAIPDPKDSSPANPE
jgi:carboxyl-terminal processing protease